MSDEVDPRPGDRRSSRLDSEDHIKMERRKKPRREEDRIRIEALRRRYAIYRRMALAAVTCWAFIATVGMIALFIQGENNAAAAKKSAAAAVDVEAATQRATQALHNAVQAKQLIAAIQKERQDSIYANCQTQNKHHDDTIKELYKIPPMPRAQRKITLARIRYTVLLINALQPKHDCKVAVHSQAP